MPDFFVSYLPSYLVKVPKGEQNIALEWHTLRQKVKKLVEAQWPSTTPARARNDVLDSIACLLVGLSEVILGVLSV